MASARADLFAVLAHVPARQADDVPVPNHRWERLARDAAVVGDADWEGRLATYQRNLAADRPHDAEAVARLRAFVTDLRALLGDPAQPRPWRHWADLCHRLLARWIGGPRRVAQLPEVEQRALDTVHAAVDRLAQLDLLDEPVLRGTFVDTLAAELDTTPGRVGRLGTGVQVGPLAYALGQSLDLVLVMGACEGQLPAPPAVDPLLGDGDRALARGGLATSDESLEEQRRQLVAALAAAPHAVITSPRGDLRSNAVRQPSRWITDFAPAVVQRRFSVPSFAAGLADASFPATATQHRVRALAHHVRTGSAIDQHPLATTLRPLHDGLAMLRARELPLLTVYDGDLTGLDVASPLAGTSAISPSRLELWVDCPFAYFARHVLGVQAVEQPEAQVQITPLDRGSLLHDALDRFHQLVITGALPQAGPAGWTAEHLTALLAQFDAVTDEYDQRGKLGRVAFWEIGRRTSRAELAQWLASDGAFLAERRATVVSSELEFGRPGTPDAVIALPGGRTARLQGKVDRIDRGADGTLYVTDHKTGSTKPYAAIAAGDPTAHGTKLQLPAYAAAATSAIAGGAGGTVDVRAEYSFVGANLGTRIGYTFTDQVWPLVGEVLEQIVAGIETGLFFALPEKSQFRRSWVTCEYCDPDHLGTAERYAEFEHKRADPRLVAFLGSTDGEEAGDGPEA